MDGNVDGWMGDRRVGARMVGWILLGGWMNGWIDV